jgi:hypothetical protein
LCGCMCAVACVRAFTEGDADKRGPHEQLEHGAHLAGRGRHARTAPGRNLSFKSGQPCGGGKTLQTQSICVSIYGQRRTGPGSLVAGPVGTPSQPALGRGVQGARALGVRQCARGLKPWLRARLSRRRSRETTLRARRSVALAVRPGGGVRDWPSCRPGWARRRPGPLTALCL